MPHHQHNIGEIFLPLIFIVHEELPIQFGAIPLQYVFLERTKMKLQGILHVYWHHSWKLLMQTSYPLVAGKVGNDTEPFPLIAKSEPYKL